MGIVNPNTSSGAVPSVVTIALTGSADALKVAEAEIAKQFESTPSAAGKVTSQGAIEAMLTVSSFKKVVLFGSGRVSRPTLKLLGGHDNVHITIATDNVAQADELRSCLDSSKTSVRQFRLPEDADSLDSIMQNCDLAISLLPATMHIPLAEAAIRNKKHLVTSSYVSPQMRELHDRAVGAGVTLMNEVGLDPGIDHMLIMKAIDDIHHRGGVVDELVSLCGGLPDPVAANNPLRYKFSWSPRGVLNAAGNSASYLSDGKIIQVPGEKLLLSAVPSPRFPTMRLETLPNRDSLLYKELYHIPKARSVCRGTLRYEGWSNCMYALKVLGTMDPTKSIPSGCSDWKSLLLSINPDLQSDGAHINMDSLSNFLASRGVKDVPSAINAIKWLGLHSSLPVSRVANSPMDAICDLLESRLKFGDTEKDMVAMYHTVIGTMPDGSKEEISSSLLAFGVPGSQGDSAMAATVGYTAGAAAELLLLNKLSTRGVVIPTIPEVYNPLLTRLNDLGITWSETVTITKTRK
jgi:saccharopine dehydrogenase-like NADP-dependent oxidoreductase